MAKPSKKSPNYAPGYVSGATKRQGTIKGWGEHHPTGPVVSKPREVPSNDGPNDRVERRS